MQSKLTPTFPLVYGVKDLSNGCAIASVLHYYCPGLLPLEGNHTPTRLIKYFYVNRLPHRSCSKLRAVVNANLSSVISKLSCFVFDPDVCLKDTMSVADSVYNLQLIRGFCQSSLQSCCPLAVEDLLYAPPPLHVSVLAPHIWRSRVAAWLRPLTQMFVFLSSTS